MATVSDGTNPGRSAKPQRQSPGSARAGRGDTGVDPTAQLGQTPDEIFGYHQSYSTGAPGSQGATRADADVTIQAGQLDEGLSGVTGGEITDTGLHGSQGATNRGGGDGVRYTDPFGYMGNEHRDSHANGVVSGDGDWTQANSDGYSGGPTLPGLEGNRPTSTGVGHGHVSAKHPNAGA